MYHRRLAIIFLVIILLIMPYYKSLKECIENPNYDNTIADKNKHSELLTDYILMLKDSNLALVNSNHDDYKSQFINLHTFFTTNH